MDDRLNELALIEWYKLTGSNKEWPDFDSAHKLDNAMALVKAVLDWRDIRGEYQWVFELKSPSQIHHHAAWPVRWYAGFYPNNQDDAAAYGDTPAEAITKAFLCLRGVDYA